MTFGDNNITIDVKEVGYVLDFLPHILTTRLHLGSLPPQPVTLLGHAPSLCPLLPIGSGCF